MSVHLPVKQQDSEVCITYLVATVRACTMCLASVCHANPALKDVCLRMTFLCQVLKNSHS